METLKAGCYLINLETKEIALVYRKKQNDFSFPKGHLEEGESLMECAIRETAEETKRVAKILFPEEPYIEEYTTPKGEQCVCYMYIAIDQGPSDNKSLDSHPLVWTPFEKVREILTYPSLKKSWDCVQDKIKKIIYGDEMHGK